MIGDLFRFKKDGDATSLKRSKIRGKVLAMRRQ
jgi:hypothetical protein